MQSTHAGTQIDPGERRMRQQHDRAISRDRQPAEQIDKAADLRAVDLVAAEHVGAGIDRDAFRLDIACGLGQLRIERRWRDLAVPVPATTCTASRR
jgi:hypothetical protein